MMTMPSLLLAVIVWGLVFVASLAGMWIGARLPETHRSADSKAVVTVTMAMVGSLTALALGLLLSVANTSLHDNQTQMLSTSSDVLRLDRLLRLYGPEAAEARGLLKQYAHAMANDLFPADGNSYNVENEATLNLMADTENAAARLSPGNANQRWLQPRMLQVADELIQQHFALVSNELNTIPAALIWLLVLWLIVLFGSYGLYAPRNLTSVIVLLLSSAAASGAILLIVEMETPTGGFIHLNEQPLQHAIAVMERLP